MTVVFDLDYTLLDTAAFKDALVAALASCGVSRSRFLATYSEITTRPGVVYDYDPDLQLDLLRSELRCSKAEAAAKIDGVVRRTADFLYPGAKEMLKRLRDRGWRLMLLTLGNISWQRAKIERSGIADLFDEVITTDKEKGGMMQRFSDDIVAIVNDNGDEVRQMITEAPEFHYLVKRGPKPIPPDLGVPICDSLEQLEKQIDALHH